ncbi:MAG: hydantoinase/oxoprolinase family protein [Pirellulaceae bacterium]
MHILGIDIGGANIKAASSEGYTSHRPFALWQQPAQLPEVLAEIAKDAPATDQIVITMTGELTDCFDHKRQGVETIVKAARQACGESIAVYLLDGRFVNCEVAIKQPDLAAASNWHGLAAFVATQIAPATSGLLIDIGSTTTDLIPFGNGRVLASGRNDFDRLVQRELVYTGVVRSPLNGIVRQLLHHGEKCPVMNELFATTLDVNIVLGHLPPKAEACWAADGGTTSVGGCIKRLARLVGKDETTFSCDDAFEMAEQIQTTQLNMLKSAALVQLQRLQDENPVMIVSGQGEFLAQTLVGRLQPAVPTLSLIRLGDELGETVSACAPAYAIARLAAGTTRNRYITTLSPTSSR